VTAAPHRPAAPTGDVAVWDGLVSRYAERWALQPPERELLRRLRGRWGTLDVLDLGCGAGRTAYTLAAVSRSYLGVDFSAPMVEAARSLVGEDDATRFLVLDARDLSSLYDRRFGLVIFSFNGIDAVGHDDRLRILAEVRRIVADEGVFAFSSHSLAALPFDVRLPRPSRRDPLRSLYRGARLALRLARANRRFDIEDARSDGFALVRDQAHDFSLVLYYVDPIAQIAQLVDAGFVDVEIWDRDGRRVPPEGPGRDPHLFYVCRPDRSAAGL